jgi:divalent metal cation (Fe/Co/Zn/Cd) transporter
VKFVFRADVSWTMERQFKELAGIINFWVCGGGEFGWYDYASSRGQRLEYFTIGYNSAEGLVSIVAGFIAGSVSLIGFGLDSVIEVASGAALLWRLHHDLSAIQREQVERTTLRVVGGSFVALALYILYESGSTLILQKAPERSIVGLIIAARNGENSVTGR